MVTESAGALELTTFSVTVTTALLPSLPCNAMTPVYIPATSKPGLAVTVSVAGPVKLAGCTESHPAETGEAVTVIPAEAVVTEKVFVITAPLTGTLKYKEPALTEIPGAALASSTPTLPPLRSATARSVLPSPLNSPTAKTDGAAPPLV